MRDPASIRDFTVVCVDIRRKRQVSLPPQVPGITLPLFPLVNVLPHLLLFFYFSLSFVGFTYFLLLSIPSLSTRIVPLRFQAGGRRKRPNLGLVCCVCVICIP